MRPDVSLLAEELYRSIGPGFTDDDEDGDWATLWQEAVVVDQAQRYDLLSRDRPTHVGWGVLLDVEATADEDVGWLGQWVGVAPRDGEDPVLARGRVQAMLGLARGRPETIRAAVRPFLEGTRLVVLRERDTSAYHYTVRVFRAEVEGDTYGDLNATYATYADQMAAFATYRDQSFSTGPLEQAVAETKPGGLITDLVVSPGATYGELDDEFGTYADQMAAFPTYRDQRSHVPAE